jgi:PAS domain S-box-containing protein
MKARRQPKADRNKAGVPDLPAASAQPGVEALIFEHADVILFCIAVEPRGVFRFVAVNRAFLKATGLKKGQVVGRRVQEVVPADSQALVLKNYRRVVRTKQIVTWTALSHYAMGDKHGEVSVSPILDAHGKVTHLAGMVHDITARKEVEAALRESEVRFRSIFEQAGVGVAIVDNVTGRYVRVNERFCKIAGRSAAQMAATTFMAITHPADLQDSLRQNQKLRTGRVAEIALDKRFVRPDGSVVWVHLTISPLWKPGEKPTLTITLAEDITERKRATEALQESEERYRLLADHTEDFVALNDTEGNRLYLSPSFFRKTGWTPETLKRRDWRARVHPDDLEKVVRTRDANLNGETTTIEHRTRCRDGSWLWVETHCKPIRSKDGKVWRLLVSSHDISERKAAEEQFKREQEFSLALVDHPAMLIMVLDAKGRIMHVNQTAALGLGYRREEFIGRTPWEMGLMDAQETARSKKRFRQMIHDGAHAPVEVRLLTKHGEWRHVELRSTITLNVDGTIDRVIITATDLTERMQMQQEVLRISEQEHARIGSDLHDGVGQTMTGVASLLEALEQELEGDAKQSARRIQQLLQEAIQEVRRMSHGLSPAAVRHRELGGALQLLAETIRTNFRTACVCQAAGDIRVTDAEKQMHLFRIAQEAVNNALRHGRPKQIKLSLQRHDEHHCVLKIENDGIGLPKGKNGSDGIGLRVMDYRANLIGGSLKVQNGRRGGVCVTCQFPCA